MPDDKFYFGVIAMLLGTLFLSILLYIIWRQSSTQIVTAADIERAREIARRLD